MAAYAEFAHLEHTCLFTIKRSDVLLPPPSLKILQFAVKELKFFIEFVERLDSRSRKRMHASLVRVAETAHKFHKNLDSNNLSLMDDAGYEYFSRGIHSLVEQTKKVVEEYHSLPEDEKGVLSKSKMIGLCDKRRDLKDCLLLQMYTGVVYSIVGMAGIGKTTLARELFEDLDICEWFNCRVWVSVGNKWTAEETTQLREVVLAQVDPEAHKRVMGGDEEEIRESLEQSLKDKVYLIVFDDVWNYDFREYLRNSFTNNGNGSRIIITTRMKYRAINAYDNVYEHISMRLLDKKESWDLLCEKVSCPYHLQDVGKKIAEKCDGLPLTIVTVADLLSNAPESLWIDVAEKRKHQLFIDAYDQISQVLSPSYEALSNERKVCLLYMGVFLQKYEIPKSRLINLWIVEDLVRRKKNQTLESHALNQLYFLAQSSVIMVYQKNSIGFVDSFSPHIKTCGLHSSWSHFCQRKAKETKLFYVLDCYDKDGIEEAIEGHSRLSIHNNVLFALKHVYDSIEKIGAFTMHSLLCFGPYCQYMVPVCFGLKFLRRLDALNIRFYDFPLEVLKLVELRYLALTCNRNLPSSISVLRKLQYLIVHPHLSIKSCGALSSLPMEIWDMKRLKHLQVVGYDLPNLGETSLQELITLADVTISSCTILNRVPNLTKLRIQLELTPDVADLLCCFDHVSHLAKLKSLNCVVVNPEGKLKVISPISSFPCFSISLKKLTLSGMGYPWEEMKKIASLPNLKVLKLRCNAFRGPKWEVEDNGFPNLRSLIMEDMDLVKLKWAHESFKRLKVLRIKHCYKLEELHLECLSNVLEIEVVDCSPLTEWHVKYNAHKHFEVDTLLVHSSWKL